MPPKSIKKIKNKGKNKIEGAEPLNPLFTQKHFTKKENAVLRKKYREVAEYLQDNIPQRSGVILASTSPMSQNIANILKTGAGVTRPVKTHQVVNWQPKAKGIPKEHRSRADVILFDPRETQHLRVGAMDFTGLADPAKVTNLRSAGQRLFQLNSVMLPLLATKNTARKGSIIVLSGPIPKNMSINDVTRAYDKLIGSKKEQVVTIPKHALPKNLQETPWFINSNPKQALFVASYRRPETVPTIKEDAEYKRLSKTFLGKLSKNYSKALKPVRQEIFDTRNKLLTSAALQGRRLTPQEIELDERARVFLKDLSSKKDLITYQNRIKENVRGARISYLSNHPERVTETRARKYGDELKVKLIRARAPKGTKEAFEAEKDKPANLKTLRKLQERADTLHDLDSQTKADLNLDEHFDASQRVIGLKTQRVYDQLAQEVKQARERGDPPNKILRMSKDHLQYIPKLRYYLDVKSEKAIDKNVNYLKEEYIKALGQKLGSYEDNLISIRKKAEALPEKKRAKYARKLIGESLKQADAVNEYLSALRSFEEVKNSKGELEGRQRLPRDSQVPGLKDFARRSEEHLSWAHGVTEDKLKESFQNSSNQDQKPKKKNSKKKKKKRR